MKKGIKTTIRLASVLLLVVVALVSAGCMPVYTEVMDQNSVITGFSNWYDIDSGMVMGQTFIPSQDNISAVDLLLRADEPVTGALTVTVRESSGNVPEDFSGSIVTTVTQDVQIPNGGSPYTTVHISFLPAGRLVAGNTYVLEVTKSGTGSTVQWLFTQENYPDGVIVLDDGSGPREVTYADWVFATYFEEVTRGGFFKRR